MYERFLTKEKDMILQEKTLEKFGYSASSLSKGSSKKICVGCDYCNKEYEKTMKNLNIGRAFVSKDSCFDCRFVKRRDVSMAKHGVENSAQRQDIRKKIGDSNAERLKSQEFKDLAKKTNMEKYGAESAMQNKEIAQKQKDSLVKKYGEDNPSKVKEIKERATESMIKTKTKNGTIKTYLGRTRPEIAKEQGFSRSHFGKLVVKHGMDKALTMSPKESSLEAFFEDWLKTTDIEYEKQYRVQRRIADFKIGNIIIELDGLYWHSDAVLEKTKMYHKIKRDVYVDNGYIPLFFREDEIYNRFDVVKSIILNKLGMNSKVFYARKCAIVEDTDCSFFEDNHLMGKGYGKIFSLQYEDEAVCSLQIRRLSGAEYEISRFASVINTSVVGGFSRLLKHVERNMDMNSLKTFIDLRYGLGTYLEGLGFKEHKPYLSFKWTNGQETFHRLKFRGNSGYDKGLAKIWDCGQAKWLKSYAFG